MTRAEIEKMRAWASAKITTGNEPPWAWYQYMKLRETLDAILAGMDAVEVVTLPADSPGSEQHPGSGHLRLVQTDPQDSAQRHPDPPPVQLPM